jgi:hypothetical protein
MSILQCLGYEQRRSAPEHAAFYNVPSQSKRLQERSPQEIATIAAYECEWPCLLIQALEIRVTYPR